MSRVDMIYEIQLHQIFTQIQYQIFYFKNIQGLNNFKYRFTDYNIQLNNKDMRFLRSLLKM